MRSTPLDRRQFVRTVTAAAGGLASTFLEGSAGATGRRRAVRSGDDGVLRSVDSRLTLNLRVAEAEVALAGRRAKLFAFNGRVPGPRLEAFAGDEVTLRLENALPEATNLHFHGLHVPPSGAADNIFLHIGSGEEFTYRFTIPRNHPTGLFWVHPHLHGAVARQVSRGLAAPFVIRGEIDAVSEIAAAHEQILVLQDFELAANGSVVEPSMSDLMQGREGSLVTANGAANPVIPILQNGLLRLRLVNASVSRFYRLQLEEHPLHLIGVDGGVLDSVRTVDEVLFVPGERLDILIEGARIEGRFRLLNLPYDRGAQAVGNNAPQTLATLEYRGRSERTWSIPASLPGGVERLPATQLPTRIFQLGQGMRMGGGMGMSFTIDGREFDENRIDSAPRLGSIEEWVYVNNTAMDHPMHLHINPFQIIGVDGSPERAWRDMILVKARGQARLRVRFDDFAGKTVQHCHILDHEDQGMMATVEMRH